MLVDRYGRECNDPISCTIIITILVSTRTTFVAAFVDFAAYAVDIDVDGAYQGDGADGDDQQGQ